MRTLWIKYIINIEVCYGYYLRTDLLSVWSRVLLTGSHLVKKFPTFYGTRSFITAFTSSRHLSLSWASSIPSIPPHPTSWRSILILSSHLSTVLPSGLFPLGFSTTTLYTPLLSPIRATCPARLILLDFITRTILCEQYRSLSSSLCSFLHSPVTSSLLGPKFSSAPCSQTPSAYFLPLVWATKFHTHTNRQNYILWIFLKPVAWFEALTYFYIVSHELLTISNIGDVKWLPLGLDLSLCSTIVAYS